LIQQLSVKRFDPNEFVDEHRARVEAAIQRKVEGKEVTMATAPEKVGGGNVVDLMEALKASLSEGGSASKDRARKPPKRAAEPASAPAKKSSRRSNA